MSVFEYARDMTYEEVRNVVYGCVRDHCARYPNEDPAMVASAAGLGYTKAYMTYDPRKGTSFKTWVYIKVSKAIKTDMRSRCRQDRRLGLRCVEVPDDVPDRSRDDEDRFRVERLLQSLSDDAKMVVQMVLDSPMDVRWMLGRLGGVYTPSNLKQAVWMVLKEVGWSRKRITETFQEVRNAL